MGLRPSTDTTQNQSPSPPSVFLSNHIESSDNMNERERAGEQASVTEGGTTAGATPQLLAYCRAVSLDSSNSADGRGEKDLATQRSEYLPCHMPPAPIFWPGRAGAAEEDGLASASPPFRHIFFQIARDDVLQTIDTWHSARRRTTVRKCSRARWWFTCE